MKYRAFSVAVIALSLTAAVRADIIELTDGRKISGSMARSGDVITIKSDDGKIITAKPADIAKVTLTSTITPEEAAAADWGRLPGLVKATDDLQGVINLYQKFLDKYPDAKQADEARSTLAVYQAMVPNDPVKFRGRWMPRTQVDVQLKQWADAARPALDLYKAGRMKETLDTIKAVLTSDGQNPDALALAGLASYRTNNLPVARTYFASLAAADPSSLLAENNLAVVSNGQKQVGESFAHYTKALQIMPDQRLLLDNIAEALYAYIAGGGDKNGPAYRALLKAYTPAETRMEQTMAKAGQVRWGSTWVSKDQKDRLQNAQDTLRDMMNRLDTQYNTIRNTLANLQGQIKQAGIDCDRYAQTMNTCIAQIQVQSSSPVNASFYQAQLDVATQDYQRTLQYRNQLQAQYDQLVGGTSDFVAQAEKLKAAFAAGGLSGQYTGTQRFMDLGDTDNPPPPTPVSDPVVPILPTPAIAITPPAPPTPPVLVPIPTGTPVFVPINPVPRGR